MTWDEVALSFGTDKASSHHGYMAHYERLLADRPIERLLEIGVAEGRSLATWRQLLPDTLVVGVDIVPQCLTSNRPGSPVLWANAAEPAHMWAVTALHGPFDVIIDDGSHIHDDVRIAFEELYPRLRPGGIYIVEDLDAADEWVQSYTRQWGGEVLPIEGDWTGCAEPCLLIFRKDF